MIISIEGVEGSGKSTVLNYLRDNLTDFEDIVYTAEPYAEDMRGLIAKHKDNPEKQLLLTLLDHFDHVDSFITPALEEGKIVITDSYLDEIIARYGAILTRDTDEIMRFFDGNTLFPDITIFLYGNPTVFALRNLRNARRRKINIMTEEIRRLSKMQDNYIKLAKEGKHRYFILDVKGSANDVCFNVENTLRYYLYRYYNTE